MLVATGMHTKDIPALRHAASHPTTLATQCPTEQLDSGMATVGGMNNQEHQDWVERECHRTDDFTFTSVSKPVKVSYTKVGNSDPFDPSVQHTPKLKATANNVQLQNELIDAPSNFAGNEDNSQRQYASQQKPREADSWWS